MYFKILGPLEVEDRGRPVRIGGTKQRALLASLALRANEVVSRDRLIDELWGERAPDGSSHRLEEHISRLRKVLHRNGEAPLLTRPGGYVLRLSCETLDVAQFERLDDKGREALRRRRPDEAATLLRRALALWRGRPLEDVAMDRVSWSEVDRLEQRRIVTYEQLIEAELARGRHTEIVDELESLVRDDPLREQTSPHRWGAGAAPAPLLSSSAAA
jgi:DNA-binding SARP family transcriptional activator